MTLRAVVALVANVSAIAKGREFAAWLGLVPKQHSTGVKPRLLSISKPDNSYLRCPFMHGTRSVVLHAKRDGIRSVAGCSSWKRKRPVMWSSLLWPTNSHSLRGTCCRQGKSSAGAPP